MGFHTFDVAMADRLEDPSRFEVVSVDELLALFDPDPTDTVADLGSGTGFYTDEVAPYAGTVYAVDVQTAMHDRYRERGLPESVVPVTAEIGDLPFDDGALDGAVSTMTYHEFATDEALEELHRVLADDGKLGIADWTAEGDGDRGPPLSERFDASAARTALESGGFDVERAEDRRESFVVEASA